MNDAIVIPTSELQSLQPPLSKADREYRAFLRLLPTLLPTYRGLYVAIHEEQVVGSGDNELELVDRTFDKVGYVPIYVGLVTDQPPPLVRIPHYRIIPEAR